MKSETNRECGFTLVELSIVMIIVGLLIGGVLKGAELIENSRIARLISSVDQITVAYNTFIDTYHGPPGDLASASVLIADCTAANFCYGGNGNLKVGDPGTGSAGQAWSNVAATINSENTQFWKHLALTGLLGGYNPSAGEVDWGQTHPHSPIAGGLHARVTRGSGGYSAIRGLILLTRSRADGQWLCGVATGNSEECSVSPRQAFRIDSKIDDGHAQTGSVAAISMSYNTGCGNPGEGSNGNNGYNDYSDQRSCDMFFWLAPL